MNITVRQVLDRHLRSEERKRESPNAVEQLRWTTPTDNWHPSSLGMCDRAAVLGRAGVEGNPLTDETLRKFWIGNVIHEAIQKVMSEDPEAGVLGHEVAVRDQEYEVSGRVDSLTRTATGTEVVEYKTIDSRAFKYGDLPYDSHLRQVACYLAFPSQFGYADRARIIYIGKSDGRIEEFGVAPTPELIQFIKSELARLTELLVAYRDAGTMPPPLDAPKSDFRIRFCRYLGTSLCCGDIDGRKPEPLQDIGALRAGTSGVLDEGLQERSQESPPLSSPRKRKKAAPLADPLPLAS